MDRKITCSERDELFKFNSKSRECIENTPHFDEVMWRILIMKMNNAKITMDDEGTIRMDCFKRVKKVMRIDKNGVWHKKIENPGHEDHAKIIQKCGPLL